MLKPVGLDRANLRRLFNQKQQPLDRADFLLAEAEQRLEARLAPMRLADAALVLDLGCGLGRSLPLLARRFPQARLVALDQAEQPLLCQQRLHDKARRGVQGLLQRLWTRPPPQLAPVWLAADAHRLPLADSSVNVIWSNLVFHWFDDPLLVLRECQRVLRPDGLLIFCTFGVDTCRELRQRLPVPGLEAPEPAPAAAQRAWPNLQDMHDWGDAMMAAGFVSPVMDVEHIRLSYQASSALQADLETLGFPAAPAGRDVSSLTIELVFGHAWIPAQKMRADGLSPVRIMRRRNGS